MVLIYWMVSWIRFGVWLYSILLFATIIASWFPGWQNSKPVYYLRKITDPYLNIFRRIIPPIGGVLDISPILAFFALQLLEKLLLRMIP